MHFNSVSVFMASDAMNFGERITYGGQVFLIGICTVFAALALLWGVISIFKIFMYDIPQKRIKKKAEEELMAHCVESDSAASVEAAVPANPAPTAKADNAQLIAAITAAITAYNTDPETGCALPFRVVSFRRSKGANGWNGADDNEVI